MISQLSALGKSAPLNIVGSTVFGRFEKISIEQTFNMYIPDDDSQWLTSFAGYKKIVTLSDEGGQGRGIYSSLKIKKLVVVVDNNVYFITPSDTGAPVSDKIATLETYSGDVFIAENNGDQIGICDKKNIYIYNYKTSTFSKADIDFKPGYISFQDGYFISVDLEKPKWRLSAPNNGLIWKVNAGTVGEFQTEPNNPVAALRISGKGNLLMVFGNAITELWYDTGGQLFPYQKNTYSNIDFGCINPATISSDENIVVWLGQNNSSGPVILMSDGGSATPISTDGINYKFSQLKNPANSYGFLYKLEGHLFYQISFPEDNLSYVYDFYKKKFYTLTDEHQNVHIAKRVAFLNNKYYFVGLPDGGVYEMGSEFTTYDGKEIPRIRICRNLRMPDANKFIVNNLTFTAEQGNFNGLEAIDLSVSKDGGVSFGTIKRKDLNTFPNRRNRLNYWNLGYANDFVPQFRFWGKGRFLAADGLIRYYQ